MQDVEKFNFIHSVSYKIYDLNMQGLERSHVQISSNILTYIIFNLRENSFGDIVLLILYVNLQ